VTVGDLLLVVYLLLVIAYLAWRWSMSADRGYGPREPLESNVFDSDEFDSGVISVNRIPREQRPRETAGRT
jgi:hypothetical protein